MFIDRNLPDFLLWKDGGASIVAKFRVAGIMQRANGNTYLSPYAQPYSFDTSKAKDPTRGAMGIVQLQVNGLTLDQLDELKDLEVCVETTKGKKAEHFLRLEKEQAFEYGSKFPLVVVVKNWKLNKQTMFITSIEKMRHETLPDEVIFRFKVEKKEERLEVLTDHPRFETQKPEPTNGDGDGHESSEEMDPDTRAVIAGLERAAAVAPIKGTKIKTKSDPSDPKLKKGKGKDKTREERMPDVRGMSAKEVEAALVS